MDKNICIDYFIKLKYKLMKEYRRKLSSYLRYVVN